MSEVPKEIISKYPRRSRLTFPDGEVEFLKVSDAVFVSDHNPEREYWKGFEIVEWSDGTKELRLCYWTRKKGSESWKWGQFNLVISLDKLKRLLAKVQARALFQ